jgi:lysyl-tRNA synthetase class I
MLSIIKTTISAFTSSTWLYAVVGLILTSLAGGCYFYYITTQNKILSLTNDNIKIEQNYNKAVDANIQNNQTIDTLQTSYKQIQEDFNNIQNAYQIIRSQNDELISRLEKHDITAIAEEKPELVEKIINNASSNANRCFELLSGSPENATELKSKTDRDFNSECPWLKGK